MRLKAELASASDGIDQSLQFMGTRHKVLIVDDEPAVLELYEELLSRLPSQPEVFSTTSGARALAMLKSEPFRLLLCDLRMPRMDGLQVLAIVRRQFPELRTVVVTGVQNEEFRSRAYALGVDLFWFKPDTQQNMEMFLQCIESLLGRDSETGFRGVQSKSLMDLLQMECLSQSSTVLKITRGPLTGRIWIVNGELIDAETEGVRGEAAFRRVLSWKSGTFENLPAEPGRERTITKPSNALFLEAAQIIDESSRSGKSTSKDNSEEAEHQNTVWRLAVLSRKGAEFVVALPNEPNAPAEAWGTEAQELGRWMRSTAEACQQVGQSLQAGSLASVETRGVDYRMVVLPQDQKLFLVGWPQDAKPGSLLEDSKQLVASWDS
jgi:CheY-like chemotaxis protein